MLVSQAGCREGKQTDKCPFFQGGKLTRNVCLFLEFIANEVEDNHLCATREHRAISVSELCFLIYMRSKLTSVLTERYRRWQTSASSVGAVSTPVELVTPKSAHLKRRPNTPATDT